MKISLNWLQDFIDLKEKNHAILKAVITANTAEIETMEALGEGLDNIVVARIDEVMPHPNADKLRIAIVSDGTEKYRVVCGGSNLKEGQKIAFAKIGAIARWHGNEVIKIEKAKIRGEESTGMICAAEEIGLADVFPKKEEKEIVDLSHLDVKIGTPLAQALGLDDVVIDIDNHALTNRADLFSHQSFAREFVANGLGSWKKIKSAELPTNNSPAPISVHIADKDVCSRYMGVYMTGIEIKESPEWIKKRLSACGIRPISNVVDVTNYVMLELGMPTHAFDVEQVKGKKWTMRKSKAGEKVITLDEKEEELLDGLITIDDGTELIDLCGIMGGLNSGIKPTTNKIWLHAPVYHPTLIRKARIGLGHISDAAIIYEKGVSDELAPQGLARCVELLLELCPDAQVASEAVDIRNKPAEKRALTLRYSQIDRLIGADLTEKQVEKILHDLGFLAAKAKDGLTVQVPDWRLGDIEIEADLIEEIARIHGYDNIPYTTPAMDISPIPVYPERTFEKELKQKLTAMSFDEIYTFAFLGPDLLAKTGMKVDAGTLELANPISADISLMRQSLVPRTLETIAQNLRYQEAFRVFEISKTYHLKGQKIEETKELVLAGVNESFRELQGTLEALGFRVNPADSVLNRMHPGRCGELLMGGKSVGQIYEVHPQIQKNFDIKPRVIIAEVNVEKLLHSTAVARPKYKELPKYPSVILDISVAIPHKDLAKKYFEAIQKTDQSLIRDIHLIDEYTGEKLEKTKRSLTYSITYQSPERTLTEDEVNAVHQKVLANLKTQGAEIR